MGGAVSAGEDNDNLVENLVNANYLESDKLIEIFRAVDRGHYYLKGQRTSAYHDIAWKFNHLHLSAPCIYSKVMEHLDLQPGMSFLNLGSGTGYLSTMAGLVLGPNGINHGIEIHDDVVEYSKERLKEFIERSPAFDRFEFCQPQFIVGNGLQLPPDIPGYDRVYCGAACPPEHANYLMNLLNIGGKLVLPLEDQLQVKTRTAEQTWDSESALAVSFAYLITPTNGNTSKITNPPARLVLTLQELCRFCVRREIRKQYKVELPKKKRRKKRERHQSLGIDDQIPGRQKIARRRPRRRLNTTGGSSPRLMRRRRNTTGDSDRIPSSGDSGESSDEDGTIDRAPSSAVPDIKEETKEDIPGDNGVKAQSSTQGDIADTTKEISLNDAEDEMKGEEENDCLPLGALGEAMEVSEPENLNTDGKEHRNLSSGENNEKGESKSGDKNSNNKGENLSKGEPSNHTLKRTQFKFLRRWKANRAEGNSGEAGEGTSERNTEPGDTSTAVGSQTEGTAGRGQSSERDRRLVHSLRSGRLVYALMRGLTRISRDPEKISIHSPMIETRETESDISSENSSAEDLDMSTGSDSDGVFRPLPETPFTIAIRKLPLPPKIISFLLHHRQ